MEIWKKILPEYEVSNIGNVRSVDRQLVTSNKYGSCTKFYKGRNIKHSPNGNGYYRIYVKDRLEYIHILVAKAFIPNTENKPQVNHKDGNKLNNHISNLEWATNGENQRHSRSLCSAGMRKNRDTHRLLAEAFIPNPGNKEQVGHKNGVKTDVRIDNLVWCDRVENTIHFHYYDCINTKLDKKRKFVLDISTGVFFYSIAEAAQAINKGHEWLRQRLNGKLKNKTNLVFV